MKPQHERTDMDGNIVVEFSSAPTEHKDRLEYQTFPKRPTCCNVIFESEHKVECTPPLEIKLPLNLVRGPY
jgi:hypothetical protein